MQNNPKFSIPVIFEELIFLIILGLFVFITPQLVLKSSELGCILVSGNEILNNLTLSIPFKGVFTDANTFYIGFNWLSDVILAFIYNIGNYQLLLVFTSIIIALVFSFTYRLMAIKNNNWLVNSLLLFAGLIASSHFLDADNRVFSLPLIIMLVYWLDKIIQTERINRNQYICIGIGLMIWANINTDFIFGLLIIMVYMISVFIKSKYRKSLDLESLFKQFVRLFIFSCLICLINPYGISLFSGLFSFYLSGLYQFNGYLTGPNFHVTVPFKFFELFILLLIFLAVFSKYRPALEKTVCIVIFIFLSLYSAVNIPFFIILSLPVIADIIKNTDLTFGLTFIKKIFDITNYKIVSNKPIVSSSMAFILVISALTTNFINTKEILATSFPQGAIDYLKANKIHGRVFNPYGWGCYLSKDLSCKVFINERLYETSVSTVVDYSTIVNIYKNYQEILDKHKIDCVIIPSSRSLSLLLNKNDKWQKVYEDKRSCVYTRNKEQ